MQLIGSEHLRRNWGKVLDDLSRNREPVIIIKHSAPIAVLIGYEEWNSIARRLSRATQEIIPPEVTQKVV